MTNTNRMDLTDRLASLESELSIAKREIEIEAALDKIRSSSLSMRNSGEIKNVVHILFEKLEELKVEHTTVAIQLFDFETKGSFFWPGNNLQGEPPKVRLPYDENLMKEDTCYKDHWEAMRKGEIIFNKTYSKEQKDRLFQYVFSHNGLDVFHSKAREYILNAETQIVCFIPEKNSALFVDILEGRPYSEDDIEVLKRAGKVFEQAYIRFLDLQKAEAQTKEAQIEAALERVRARTMAMHTSTELMEVSHELRRQLGILGIEDLDTCVIHLYEESIDDVHSWAAIKPPESEGEIRLFQEKVPKKGLLIIEEALDAYRSEKQDYVLVNEGSKILQWFSYMEKKSPEAYIKFMESTKGTHPDAFRSYWACADFEGGSLLIVTATPPEEISRTILRRFANVFGLAYRRFADLKQSEAQASRLKELDAVKTKLYTNITHEFRTPLTVILGMAHQVLENPNVLLGKGMEMITRNAQNLLTLVNQMLDLSKLESGKLTLQNKQADIIPFLEYLVDSFQALAKNRGIQLHFIPANARLILDFDEIRMQQVVSNLISNAIKFTLEGGNIYVSVDTKNEKFILTIKDTGIGIADADLPFIFDRFYQADDSHTRHGEGTGIGLAITREIIKLMEGSVTVKSYKRKGAEFEVILPMRPVGEGEKKSDEDKVLTMEIMDQELFPIDRGSWPPVIEKIPMDTTKVKESPLILIADDNEDVLSFVSSCLNSDYIIDIAKNGRECEEMAYNLVPQLIVLDVMMPYKDGFDVCKNLKNDERTSHIPIIMLTAKADLASKLEGLEQGADAYLTKPFHKNELLLTIRKLLDLRRKLQQYYRSSLEVGISQRRTPNAQLSSMPFGSESSNDAALRKLSIPLANSLENKFVIKVKHTIEAHLEESDFDVETLCHLLTLSRSQVHRKLSALTGLSATHFIRFVRLLKAKEMIINSGFSIAAVAYDCGFNDPAYFSRVFKQEFGVSPHVWRERNSD
jgi:signal transduction histidine kinase/DNA-binding response OmpR family regulator